MKVLKKTVTDGRDQPAAPEPLSTGTGITTVITTAPSRAIPATTILEQTIESLKLVALDTQARAHTWACTHVRGCVMAVCCSLRCQPVIIGFDGGLVDDADALHPKCQVQCMAHVTLCLYDASVMP